MDTIVITPAECMFVGQSVVVVDVDELARETNETFLSYLSSDTLIDVRNALVTDRDQCDEIREFLVIEKVVSAIDDLLFCRTIAPQMRVRN